VGRLSEHHLGRAIYDEIVRRDQVPPRAAGLRNQRGLGAVAEVGGQAVAIGRLQFVTEVGGLELSAAERARVEELQGRGRSLVFVVAGAEKGVVALEDRIRSDAAAALRSLKANGVGRTVLLTGDHKEVAQRVADEVGVDEFQAQLMPEDKVTFIRSLAARGGQVAMVGDGVNDAPALAASSVGVAMGLAGTDAALEVADLVLVRDRLDDLAYALRLAQRSLRIIRQNLAFACAVIAVLVVINLLYGLPLPIGVIGHEGSTILVVLNGLRLLRPLPAEGELE
jgi:Cd2+/Zn2+-exporting ATPase